MKSKKVFTQFVCLILFVIVFAGCDKDNDDGPVVVNQPPAFSGLEDGLTLSPGFETHDLDLASYFTDQEGDIITYKVSNSNDDVITLSLENTTLTITEVEGPGSSDITVIASDGIERDEVNEKTFTVTIEEITGAADFTGNAVILFDFNGLEGSVFDDPSPLPEFLFEGWGPEDQVIPGTIILENNHLVITNDVDSTTIWSETELDGNQDCTGKKFRFDYSFLNVPTLTGTTLDDDPSAVDIQIYFVDETWELTGGQVRFSDLDLTYSPDWQTVEIPLADFNSFWGYEVDPSAVGVIGIEIWGASSDDPISFRLDNFGIVD
jgi:hypothetical protein